MELKTKVTAEANTQSLQITRDFDIPVESLFEAYSDADILSQWMGTNVLKLENKNHGGYQFETTSKEGHVVFRANGVIHEIMPNEKITRTFQIENTPFPIQLEFLEFHKVTEETSKLSIHVVYKSVADRNQILKLPFASNLSLAHDRLQNLFKK